MPRLLDSIPPAPDLPEEGTALAINLLDLERVHPTVRESLLGHGLFLLHQRPVLMDRERMMDETGLAFACPLLQAAAICDLIRDHDRKAGDTPTRVYLRRVRAWEKVSAEVSLMQGDRLNPKVFPPQRAAATDLVIPKRQFKRI